MRSMAKRREKIKVGKNVQRRKIRVRKSKDVTGRTKEKLKKVNETGTLTKEREKNE